jgi:hypothetical protein
MTLFGGVAIAFVFAFFVDNLEIENRIEQAWLVGIRWSVVPSLIFGIIVIWGCRRSKRFKHLPVWHSVEILGMALLFCVLLSGGIVTIFNAYIGPSETVILEGTVVRESTHSRQGSIMIVDERGKILTLLSDPKSDRLKKGERYSTVALRGSLGFLFKWRFSKRSPDERQ